MVAGGSGGESFLKAIGKGPVEAMEKGAFAYRDSAWAAFDNKGCLK